MHTCKKKYHDFFTRNDSRTPLQVSTLNSLDSIMFGTFRLFLSCAVIVFHMGINAGGLFPGVAAVICFLMVSGYAMSGLREKAFSRLIDAPFFYADRALRLVPQYWFYVLVSVSTIYLLGWHFPGYQDGALSLRALVCNLLLPPFGSFLDPVTFGHATWIPQAWSLGIEIMFYLLLPLLLASRWIMAVALVYAAWVFARATHGILNPDLDAYRIMPAPLLWLLAGAALQRRDWPMFGSIALFAAGLFTSLEIAGKARMAMNAPLFLGVAIGFAIMPLLARLPRRRWDDQLGNASYGAFLAHYVFVAAFRTHLGDPHYVAIAVAASIACGALSYVLIEMPAVRLRHWIRLEKGKAQTRLGAIAEQPR